MTEPADVANEIIRRLRLLTVAVLVCLALCIGIGVFAITQSIQVGEDADRTTGALCALRVDLQSRVDQTETFLLSHPSGFAGIPRATLNQSLEGQKRTIAALRTLQCPPDSTAPAVQKNP